MEKYRAVIHLGVLAPNLNNEQGGSVGCKYEYEMELPIYVPAVAGLQIWLEYKEGEGDFMLVKEVELWSQDRLVLNCITSDHYMPEGMLVNYSSNMLVPYVRMLEITDMLDRNSKWKRVV